MYDPYFYLEFYFSGKTSTALFQMVPYFVFLKIKSFLTGKANPECMFINILTITFSFFSKLTPDIDVSVQSFLTKIFHNLQVKPIYCFSTACPLYRNISI